jgi:hypothetical protein
MHPPMPKSLGRGAKQFLERLHRESRTEVEIPNPPPGAACTMHDVKR